MGGEKLARRAAGGTAAGSALFCSTVHLRSGTAPGSRAKQRGSEDAVAGPAEEPATYYSRGVGALRPPRDAHLQNRLGRRQIRPRRVAVAGRDVAAVTSSGH